MIDPDKVKFIFAYTIENSVASQNVDANFYPRLPNVAMEIVDGYSGSPVTDIPSPEQFVKVMGSSEGSPSAIATTIYDYLQGRSRATRITVEGAGQTTHFDGPEDLPAPGDIEAILRTMHESGADEIVIECRRISS